jgi:hypothetical protein
VEARPPAHLRESIGSQIVVVRRGSSIFTSRSPIGREYQLQTPSDTFKKAIQSTKGPGNAQRL